MEEVQAVEVVAEVPAPEQVETASPETEVVETPEQPKETKTFTQEEVDALIGKRLAREQRKWEREQQQRMQQPRVPENVSADQFETPEAYAEALAIKKAQELLEQRERQRIESETLDAYHNLEEEARSKYEDFEQVAYNPRLPITDVMAKTIQASDVGPDIAYFLGSNPKEADRISRLSPILQAKEIGKIEAKISDAPIQPKKTSSAPAPISPVKAASSGDPVYDTTDPRSIKTMSTSEWIERERQRQIKKLESQKRY